MDNKCIYHDSRDIMFRNPFGAVPCGQTITLVLRVSERLVADKVSLRLWEEENGERLLCMKPIEERDGYIYYEGAFKAPVGPGLLWYYFIIQAGCSIYYYGTESGEHGGAGRIYDRVPGSYQITVFRREYMTPRWFKDCVMYQIFVDRFFCGKVKDKTISGFRKIKFHSNWDERPDYLPDKDTGEFECIDFYGGDLEGIIEKICYLKDLGIDVIYLNPIFESPSNHKYDTGNYMKIDPMFGDNNTFKRLCSVLSDAGIRIILDGVFSHTGSDSIYFNKEGHYPSLGAYQSRESPYYNWYKFTHYPDEYECWWGFKTLPNTDELEPSYMNFILRDKNSVLKHWMMMGTAGWRLDVADELPDKFIKELRKTAKETDADSIIIGEVWEDASNKVSYGVRREYLLGEELDSVMNYPLREALIKFFIGEWDAAKLNSIIMSLYENYPIQAFYSLVNLAGSHDTPRIKTLLVKEQVNVTLSREEEASFILNAGQEELALKRIKLFSLFQMCFPGVPCIYYGDEAGLQGLSDPFNRGTYPWGREDKDLIRWYRNIISLRHSLDALRTGDFKPLLYSNDVYAFLRHIDNNIDVFGQERNNGLAIVIINRSKEKNHQIGIDLNYCNLTKMYDVLNENASIAINDGKLIVDIMPLEGMLLYTPL